MSRFNKHSKFLDYVFKNEQKIDEVVSELKYNGVEKKYLCDSKKWLEVINETYEAAEQKKVQIAEIAGRRFRKREFYVCTCMMMYISPAKYYRLLSTFFKIADQKVEKIFQILKK